MEVEKNNFKMYFLVKIVIFYVVFRGVYQKKTRTEILIC